MPRLSRLYVRAALVYLLAGFTIGALMLANKGVPFLPVIWRWLPAHIESLLVGWTLQLALGVAFWVAPRFWQPPRRGNETGARLAFGLLNAGILLVIAASLSPLPSWSLPLGRLLELAAVIAFAVHLWGRVVGRDFRPRRSGRHAGSRDHDTPDVVGTP